MTQMDSSLTFTVGLALSFILYGILVNQTVTYYRSKSNDRLWTKLVVFVVVLLETAMILFNIIKIYLDIILKSALEVSKPIGETVGIQEMFSGNTVIMSLISTTVQLFFSWRVSALSSHRILPGLIALGSVCSLALSLALYVLGTSRIMISQELPTTVAELQLVIDGLPRNSFGLTLSWLILCAAVDIILSIYLTCYLLMRRTGFRSSDLLVRKIVRFTVETGTITSVCAILDAVLHTTHNLAIPMFIPDLMLSKLYANSLLASLNARSKWADEADRQDRDAYQEWRRVNNAGRC